METMVSNLYCKLTARVDFILVLLSIIPRPVIQSELNAWMFFKARGENCKLR